MSDAPIRPIAILERAARLPEGHGVTLHFNNAQQARAYKLRLIAARGNAAKVANAAFEKAAANPEWTGELPPLETGYEDLVVINPDGAPASLWVGKPIAATYGIVKVEG